MSRIKRSIYRSFVLLSYVLCLYLFDKFSIEYTHMVFQVFYMSAPFALISIFWRTYYVSDDYPGFFFYTMMIDVFVSFVTVYSSEVKSVITICVLAYMLYFPSAYVCYFILQSYEVKRSGGY